TKVDDWEFKCLFGVLLVDNVEEQRWGKEIMSAMLSSNATFSMEMFPFGHCPEGMVTYLREKNVFVEENVSSKKKKVSLKRNNVFIEEKRMLPPKRKNVLSKRKNVFVEEKMMFSSKKKRREF
nr:hypothetical protein [Tanacetum cinerariifolium]